jgi:hypothetical protein
MYLRFFVSYFLFSILAGDVSEMLASGLEY